MMIQERKGPTEVGGGGVSKWPLVRLAKASLTLGYAHKAWRGTRVIFIPKAGKKGLTSPKDFRPISLTSFVLKKVERLLDRYIHNKMSATKSLHSEQHAYMAGHSTETALSKAVNLIEDQLNLKGFAIGTFMDIDGAYNHTSSEVIRRAMIRQGVPIAIVEWTCHMLGNRNIMIAKGNTTLRGIADSECSQGGVLSPLLWSLVVDELLHLLTDQGCHPVEYADDILVIVLGMHLDALNGVMQQTLKVVDTRCRTIGLSVNPGKPDVVIFTRRHKWSTTRILELKKQRL